MIRISLMQLVLEYYGADLRKVKPYGWRACKCPFHDDRVASGRVNLEVGGFRCMACRVSGDALKLIKNLENLESREDAEQWANEKFGAENFRVRQAATKRKTRDRPTWRDTLLD